MIALKRLGFLNAQSVMMIVAVLTIARARNQTSTITDIARGTFESLFELIQYTFQRSKCEISFLFLFRQVKLQLHPTIVS